MFDDEKQDPATEAEIQPAPAAEAPLPTGPVRVILEFGDRKVRQTHDIQPSDRCGDLIAAVKLSHEDFSVLSHTGEALSHMARAVFQPGSIVKIARTRGAGPGPVFSGSGQHLL